MILKINLPKTSSSIRTNLRQTASAKKVTRGARASNNRNRGSSGNTFGITFTMLFCIGLLASVFSGKLPVIIVGLYIVMSLIAFIAYAIDKSAAQNGRWRTKESTLHTLSVLGGWPGAYFAQIRLRHKSSKKEFKNVYWVTVVLNLAGLFWLHTEQGTNFRINVINQLLNG